MIGLTIGNYRVTRKLGEGGMGAVYEAQHATIGRRAALKVLHPTYAGNPEVVTRFFNEARAANLISHPGMVAVFDYGLLPDGTAYLVMELLVGETLTARQERAGGRLGHDALRFGRQIAGALGAAHAAGIVHRDLKPDNVMVVADPEAVGGERVKILDFGIAKLAEHHAMTNAGQTRTGAVMGTPLYMAPEQCRGAGVVDDRADVYALGAMLYHQLAGRPVFEAEGTGAMLAMHIYEAPLALHEVAPDVAPSIAEVVHRMLEKEAHARPSMPEVEGALAALLSGGPVPAGEWRPPGRGVGPGPAPRTTLSGASGVRTTGVPSMTSTTSGRSWRAALIAGSAVAAAGAVGVAVMNRPAADAPVAAARHQPETDPALALAAPAPRSVEVASDPAPVRSVRWIIASEPAGAEVRDGGGARLGFTPLTLDRPAAPGIVTLELHLAGYRVQYFPMDGARDATPTIGMVPEAQAAPAVASSRSGRTSNDKRNDKREARRPEQREDQRADSAPPSPAAAAPPAVDDDLAPVKRSESRDEFERRLEEQTRRSAAENLKAKPLE